MKLSRVSTLWCLTFAIVVMGMMSSYAYAAVERAWVDEYYFPNANRWEKAVDLGIDSQGYVIVAGHRIDNGQYTDLVKYYPNYTIGSQQYCTAQWIFGTPVALAIDNDDNILIIGNRDNGTTGTDWVISKYNKYCQRSSFPYPSRIYYNGSANGHDTAIAVATDSSGNVIVTGSIQESSPTGGSQTRGATVKFDPNGQIEWEKIYDCCATAMRVDENDNVILVGGGFITRKYAADGTELWVRDYDTAYDGGFNYDDAYAVAADSGGNIYVTGVTRGRVNSTNTQHLTIKYDADGSMEWNRLQNGQPVSGFGRAIFLKLDPLDNVIVAGLSEDTNGSDAIAVIKYSSAGNELWAQQYQGPIPSEFADMAIDKAGNIVVVGSYNPNNSDWFTRKLGPDGSILWLQTYNDLESGNDYCSGNYSDDAAKAVGTDDLGNVYVTGYNCSIGDYRLGQSWSYNFVTIKYEDNQPPVALCRDREISLTGGVCTANATVDNGSFDPDGDSFSLNQTPTGPYGEGETEVTLTATDENGLSDSCTATVTVLAATPTISCPADVTVDANPLLCSATANSVSLGTPSTPGVCGAASVTNDAPEQFPVGTTAVTWTVDVDGVTATCQQQVTVVNPEPGVTLTGPPTGSLFPVNAAVDFSATFTDVGGGTHTGTWMFDGLSQAATITEPIDSNPGLATATTTFGTTGVYTVELTIEDSCGGSATADQMDGTDLLVVVYDPNGSFVTGGGWIMSPPGACQFGACTEETTGKANFGFVSKYKKGTNVPTGNTEFQFHAGSLNFNSTAYEWLVVAGARAQFKGMGTINGAGSYGFMLYAIDGQLNGGGGIDKFRIKIWYTNGDSDIVVYDNFPDQLDDAEPPVIGGGSIVIHQKGKTN